MIEAKSEKARGGRPKATDPRDTSIAIRVTHEEKARLKKLADANYIETSKMARSIILGFLDDLEKRSRTRS